MPEPSAHALAEHRALVDGVERLLPQVDEVARRLIATFEAGGQVLALGNGGSAADAQHLAAELVGRFDRDRRPLPAASLAADSSVLTCIANDYDFEDVFARQIEAAAAPEDTVVAFTTSGRSASVVKALAAARARGATTVLFVGGVSDPPAAAHADLTLAVPSTTTARIQEVHLLLLHLVVEQVDAWAAQ
jgi:D-sedoheptulose 7-phosphate isomerase